jgi:putative tricarboxylic transport membrane protein
MTRQGLAAKALGYSLIAAFVGGIASAVLMVAMAKPVADIALKFSSPEFFAVIIFGLSSVVSLGGKSMINALISLCMGLLIASVGVDSMYGQERLAFGQPFLLDGIEFLLVMVGAYGIGEVLTRLGAGYPADAVIDPATKTKRFETAFPRWSEIYPKRGSFVRGTATGVVVGLVPGAGATVSSFVASVGGALVPLLTMGIPGSGATAIILAAFLLHGIQPGPQVFVSSSALIYTVFASVFISVIGMCILGYFAIKPLTKVLDAPEAVVSAFVVMFCFVGAFAARNNMSDLYVIAAFGLIGFLFERFKFPIAPLVLGTILGPLAEDNFMTTMVSFSNDWTIFFTRPISLTILVIAAIGVFYPAIRATTLKRRVPSDGGPSSS